ncbi:signal peptidase I [Magnetovibrio sp. PR-2]|uniref:signal peptidase I n=1 Tax=Magnetovibrio sp. PR-2 TaxID=3120356 RepID=UPI002FCDEA67
MINIFSDFQNRRPWCVVVLALIFDPVVAMMYLGRGRLALIYLAFTTVSVLYIYWPLGPLPFGLSADISVFIWSISLKIGGAIHGYVIARSRGSVPPMVWFSRWYWIVGLAFVLPIAAGFSFQSLVMERYRLPSISMEPTIKRLDTFWGEKYAYGYSAASFGLSATPGERRFFYTPPKRGDVIVFLSPEPNSTPFVKRLIGLPGDSIQMKGGVLFINGQKVERERVGDYVLEVKHDYFRGNLTLYRETLPNGVQASIVEKNDTYPLDNTPIYHVPEGHFFVLGDNRDYSTDSRTDEIGFVPMEALVGRIIP